MQDARRYDSQVQSICLMILTGLTLMYALYWLRPVLVPFVVAFFVVSGISPILDYLEEKLNVSRLIAAVICFFLGIMMIIGLGFFMWLSVLQLADEGEAYRKRITEIVTKVEKLLEPKKKVSTANADVNEDPDKVESARPEPPGPDDNRPNTMEKLRKMLDEAVQHWLSQLSIELVQFVSTCVVVMIYVLFLLLGKTDIGEERNTIRMIDEQVRSYLIMKTGISIVTGLTFGVALWMFGVPMALTFGLLAFLLNFIPNIGPIIACLLPIPFILLSPNGDLLWMISAISVTSAIQIISGNVVEPKMMGDSAGLHPIVVLLGLMLLGMLWGITGMFLATPVTAAVKIVLEKLEPTRRIAEIMAGNWTGDGEDLGSVQT